jgi:Fic family protein
LLEAGHHTGFAHCLDDAHDALRPPINLKYFICFARLLQIANLFCNVCFSLLLQIGGRMPLGRPSREYIYARFESSIQELKNYGGLPKPHEAPAIWDGLWHLEAHHSTAIEGNTLVLREVEELLKDKRAVGSKALKDYMEVLGYGEAAQWVYTQALTPSGWQHDDLINMAEVRQIHAVLMEKVWSVAPHDDASPEESPGKFRQHQIRAFSGGMTPPSHVYIQSELQFWVDEANAMGRAVGSGTTPPRAIPERLAKLHRDFEQIHPFIDGNGRTGRLLLNLILLRMGWPTAIIYKRDRDKYLRALDKADNGDFGPLAELICRSVETNLHTLIPMIAGNARYVPLRSLANERMTYPALRGAATRGRLEAIQDADGMWRSSRHAVDKYLESKYERVATRPAGPLVDDAP